MSFWHEIGQNKALVAALTAWALAQFIKVLIGYVRDKRFNFKWFLRSGGMPSSHVSLSSCLTTSIGLEHGFDSGLFAVALGFTAITMFDAQGVRRHSGKQAALLNTILDDIYSHKEVQEAKVKELLGHTPFEVFAGFIFGILIAWAFHV